MGLGHEKIGRLPSPDNVGRLGGKGYNVAESSAAYRTEPVTVDSDCDREDEKLQQAAARNALTCVGAP